MLCSPHAVPHTYMCKLYDFIILRFLIWAEKVVIILGQVLAMIRQCDCYSHKRHIKPVAARCNAKTPYLAHLMAVDLLGTSHNTFLSTESYVTPQPVPS